MTPRAVALLASRIVAIYVGFHAVIYSGEFAHDLLRARPVSVLARSAAPIASLVLLAGVLWFLAPSVADALLRDRPSGRDGEDPTLKAPPSAEVGLIAFAVVGLFIASQAAPLLASTVQRLVGGVWSRDSTGDLVAAGTRIAIGAAVFFKARALSRAVLRVARRES